MTVQTSTWVRRLIERVNYRRMQTSRLNRHPIPAANIPVFVDTTSGRVMFGAQDVTGALRGIAAIMREHPEMAVNGLDQIADQWDMAVLETLNDLRADGKNGEGQA
jgi:hypothetical protein